MLCSSFLVDVTVLITPLIFSQLLLDGAVNVEADPGPDTLASEDLPK